MDLNLNVFEGLKLLGDSINVPDQAFKTLHNVTHDSLMDTENKDATPLGL